AFHVTGVQTCALPISAVKAEIAEIEARLRERAPESTGPVGSPSLARAQARKQMLETELKTLREEERQLRPAIANLQARLERMPQIGRASGRARGKARE